MRTGFNGIFMGVEAGICALLACWNLCVAACRYSLEEVYFKYLFLILAEYFSVIGPVSICVVSSSANLSQNAIYLNLFKDVLLTVLCRLTRLNTFEMALLAPHTATTGVFLL